MSERIDAHQHFWIYAPDTHAWIDASMATLQRDFLPVDLAPLLDAAGFDGCIAVQAQQDVAETEWLLALAREHRFIRGVVGWVDLRASDVHQALERLAEDPALRGVRHVVQDEPAGFMSDAAVHRGIAALEKFDLAYDILIHARQLDEATALVRAFPRQRFVVDHIAKPAIRSGEFDAWRRDLAALAGHPNVFCKLSGMVTEADWRSWSPKDIEPYIATTIELFGAERLMVGSDWPVCTLAASYSDVMRLPMEQIAALTAHERDLVLGGTAARFYKLR